LRLLIVDDNVADAELDAHLIANAGYPCIWRRVERETELRAALERFRPDLIISDFTLPSYDGLSALDLAAREAPETPFVFVSGTIGECRAAEAMLRGAADYVSKQDLTRLVPTVTRVLSERRLPFALERNQFRLYYQPIGDICTGRIVGAEALLRWCDPDRGVLPPSQFLPILESNGMMSAVGDWVLGQALRDTEHWPVLGLPSLRVALNVSPGELAREDFAPRFLDAARHAATGTRLDIEVTESALLQRPETTKRCLSALRAEGVRVAIDDFGTGYSSLSRLAELPLDTLKIDRAFNLHIVESTQNQAIVSTIIALASACGLATIAEGIESAEQVDILRGLGCEQCQGNLFSPAVSADEIESLLAQETTLHVLRRRSVLV
jgi:EAL domain-containing protein (putative c-di-GMP-specific phosphodiesterase class I)/CheY-like chemotaxis protein